MSLASWLFLFGLLSALGSLAAVGSLALQLLDRRRQLKSSTESTESAEVATVNHSLDVYPDLVISRRRLGIVTIFLLVSLVLSISGFVSSIRKEEQLKPALRPENLEVTLRSWLDRFNVSSKKVDDDQTFFQMVAGTSQPIAIARKKSLDQYVVLQTSVTVGPTHKILVDKLSKEEINQVAAELVSEMARAKMGFIMERPPLTTITLIKRIPITNDLTEASFLEAMDEMEFGGALARNTIVLELEKRTKAQAPAK